MYDLSMIPIASMALKQTHAKQIADLSYIFWCL